MLRLSWSENNGDGSGGNDSPPSEWQPPKTHDTRPRRIRVRWPRRKTTDTREMAASNTRAMAATDDDRYAGDRYAGDGRAREGDGGTRTMAAWRDADDGRRSSDLLTKSESLIVMSLVVMSGGGECETNNSGLFLCARE